MNGYIWNTLYRLHAKLYKARILSVTNVCVLENKKKYTKGKNCPTR